MKHLLLMLALMAPQMVMAQAWRGYEEDEYYDKYGSDDSSGEFWFYPPAAIATIIILLIGAIRLTIDEAKKNKNVWVDWRHWCSMLGVVAIGYFIVYLPVILVGALLKKIFL